METLYANLSAEEILLTEELKKEKKKKISIIEEEVKTLQTQIFGPDGLYFLKKQELIKPIQDEIFEATKKVAKANKLSILFDKSADLILLYTDPVHDYTDFVLEELSLLQKEQKN